MHISKLFARLFHHRRSIKEKASSCRSAPNPFAARAPEQKEELGLGSGSLDSHLIASSESSSILEPAFPGDQLAGAAARERKKNKIKKSTLLSLQTYLLTGRLGN